MRPLLTIVGDSFYHPVVRTDQSPDKLKGASPSLCLLAVVVPSLKKYIISVQLGTGDANHDGEVSEGAALGGLWM